MALPNVNINLGNGGLGRVSATDDGVAGLILTGVAIAGKFELDKVYTLGSTRDLTNLGITEDNNPFIYKEVNAFYKAAGDGAELYLLAVEDVTSLTEMCDAADGSPIRQIIDAAGGRIRLLGVNRNPGNAYTATLQGAIDKDVITAAEAVQAVAQSYASKMWPIRVLLPAFAWDGDTNGLYKPREASYNRAGIVLASDGKYGDCKYYSAAIGQVLGRAASIAVNVSIARVRSGSIAATGYLSDGSVPEEKNAIWDALDAAGYIFYRTFVGKAGYYLNDDHMAAPLSDDYSSLNLGRVIDKAIIIAYTTYIDYIMENVAVDDNGQIPASVCKDFEAAIIRAVNVQMANEISSFSAYINPAQNIISSGAMDIGLTIVPTAILKQINIDLSFTNPFE
jgi:hypothetical protein